MLPLTLLQHAPGGIITDFWGRCMDVVSSPMYDDAVKKLFDLFDFNRFSTAEQIAKVVYEAATDGKDQLRYAAGEDAKSTYARDGSSHLFL